MKVDLARIDAKSSEGETFSIDVNEDNPVALGRGPELKIDATSISRKHLEIRLLANQVLLKCNHNKSKSTCDWLEFRLHIDHP